MHYRVAGDVVALLIDEQERDAHYSVDQLAEHIAEFSLAALGQISPYTAAPQITAEQETACAEDSAAAQQSGEIFSN